jgi:hypothetical protein
VTVAVEAPNVLPKRLLPPVVAGWFVVVLPKRLLPPVVAGWVVVVLPKRLLPPVVAGWLVAVVAPKRDCFGVVVEAPKRDEPKPKPDEGWVWVGVVVAPPAGLLPNSEFPVVVEPKMLLPAPVAPGVDDCPRPKPPDDAPAAGVPLLMKNDMAAASWCQLLEFPLATRYATRAR